MTNSIEKSITKSKEEWSDIAQGLQIILNGYVLDTSENGQNPKDAPYVANASHFIMELTNDCLKGNSGF
jgi:hypothetical protein